MKERMDPITPTSPPASNVDSLLNDILSGQPADDQAASVSTPPSPNPQMIPTLSNTPDADSLSDRIARETDKDEVEDTADRIHDMLEGNSDEKSQVAPGMTPVVKESSLDALASMPTLPMDVSPAPTAMPTLSPTSTPMAPVTPTPSVSSVAAPAVSQPQVAQAPKPGIPKAGIAAALVILAVTIAGVGAGVALSGQEQDVRNQAYVAPSPVAQQAASAPVDPNSMVILTTSGENAYNDMKKTHTGAREVTVSSGGLSGIVSLAETEIGSKVLFARLSGVPTAPEGKKMVAWVMFANGEYAQIGDLDNVTSNGDLVSFIAYENFSDQPFSQLVISEENLASTSDSSLDVLPTQKVANVAL